jgi:two-component system chemotaxis sensor kinase CheA|tara:strand:- start:332 stop:2635 length:2304 start_codon:yes stop_codon:yes gene_type:complete
VDNPALEEFVEEVEEIIEDLEEGVLELEVHPKKRSLIDRIFRDMHTIKGGAGMVMETELAEYAHHFENLLDKARNGDIVCTPEMASLLLSSIDGFRSFMDKIREGGDLNHELIDKTLIQLREFESNAGKHSSKPPAEKTAEKKTAAASKSEPTPVEKIAPEDSSPQEEKTAESEKSKEQEEVLWDDEDEGEETAYLLHLKFDSEMLRKGSDPILLLKDLKELGDFIIIPHLGNLPDLKKLDPEDIHLWWSAKLVTTRQPEEIENILIFFQDEKNEVTFEPAETPPEDPGLASFGIYEDQENNGQENIQVDQAEVDAKLVERHEPILEAEEGQKGEEVQETANEISADTVSTEEEPKAAVPEVQPKPSPLKDDTKKDSGIKATQSIRVTTDKLDKLQNLVGETVINQARLHRLSDKIMEIDVNLGEMLLQFVEDNEKSVYELQEQILQVRMIPVGSILNNMKRTVRDYATRSKKKIKLEIEGGDTELDKTVTEQLQGPLVHLVRNSMDHGIEDSETRVKHGKDPTGTIYLKASQQEGYVIVEIEDDGKGIDSKVIFDSAVKKGFINEADILTEDEIYKLLFLPGFTTTAEVTDVSGRGVGMDTVKRDIEALLGTIEISSELHKGTSTKLKLPLTLAIIEGMMIDVGNQIFTIPLLSVSESLRPVSTQIKKIKNKGELVEIRGEYIPMLRLHERLKIKPKYKEPTEGLVVVVKHANQKQCLLVDEIVDQGPVVIKSMEDNFIQVPGIAGATILGNGEVSFILDIASLVN